MYDFFLECFEGFGQFVLVVVFGFVGFVCVEQLYDQFVVGVEGFLVGYDVIGVWFVYLLKFGDVGGFQVQVEFWIEYVELVVQLFQVVYRFGMDLDVVGVVDEYYDW